MQTEDQSQAPHDPFNFTYFLVFVVVLVGLPLMHIIMGWLTFFFNQ